MALNACPLKMAHYACPLLVQKGEYPSDLRIRYQQTRLKQKCFLKTKPVCRNIRPHIVCRHQYLDFISYIRYMYVQTPYKPVATAHFKKECTFVLYLRCSLLKHTYHLMFYKVTYIFDYIVSHVRKGVGPMKYKINHHHTRIMLVGRLFLLATLSLSWIPPTHSQDIHHVTLSNHHVANTEKMSTFQKEVLRRRRTSSSFWDVIFFGEYIHQTNRDSFFSKLFLFHFLVQLIIFISHFLSSHRFYTQLTQSDWSSLSTRTFGEKMS